MILISKEESRRLTVNGIKRYRQRMQILSLLYEHRSLSASDLSKEVRISLPTTKTLLDELIALKAVETSGIGESRGGRKPALYSLVAEAFYIVAVDMGRYKAKATIFNCHNEEVTPIRFIETNIDDPKLVDKLHEMATEMVREAGISEDKIVAVGVDMPGLIDSVEGINYTIKNASLQNVKRRFGAKFRKTVYIDNDARMQAFGEFVFGKAQNTVNSVVLNWSWGLGVGMILNGQLYSGSRGFAGEFSHIRLEDEGELCICGKRGCIETMASANKLLSLAKSGVKNGTISQLTRIFKNNPDEMQTEDVINAARGGDEFAISILNQVGSALGKGLSILIQLLNPELIVLSGPISQANQYIMTPIQQSLNQYCLENICSNVRLEISEIDEHSGLLGIAAMLFQKVFGDAMDELK